MTQAESVLSTPPTNTPADPARRRFLSQAAGVAAGGTVLALATTTPALAATAPASPLAHAEPDPVFAAIEAHKAAVAAMSAAVGVVDVREDELKTERAERGGKPEPVDDAKLAECEAALNRAFDAETAAACALLSALPTTFAGVIALLEYAIAADTDGEGWPCDLEDDDGKTRSWQFFLINALAEVLPGMVAS